MRTRPGGGRARAVLRALVAALFAALCLAGLASPPANAVRVPPTDLALAWGDNSAGQLGDGTTTARATPVAVALPDDVQLTAIAPGYRDSLALTSDGRVYAWGANDFGQAGNGTTVSSSTPVEADLPPGTVVTAIAAGGFHSLALTSDGRVYAWGRNNWGQLGDGTTIDRSTPVEVRLPSGTEITAITAGTTGNFSLALTSDGRVLGWGLNNGGQLGNGTSTGVAPNPTPAEALLPPGTDITVLAAGGVHTLALTSDGRVLAWGINQEGDLGDGTRNPHYTPIETHIPAGTKVTAIAAGSYHSLAVTSDGRVLGWGANWAGQLGDGTLDRQLSPVYADLPAGIHATDVKGDFDHSLALTADGHVYSWGGNDFGQLGDGTTEPSTTPVRTNLPPGVRVTAIGTNGQFSLALAEPAPTPAGSLHLAKRVVSAGPFAVGDTVEYAYTVTNTGDAALGSVTVTDNLIDTVTCDSTALAAGENTTCHGGYTVTEADLAVCAHAGNGDDGGNGSGGSGYGGHGTTCSVTNTAAATATDPQGETVTSNTATATIQVTTDGHGTYGDRASYGGGKSS
ncbi:RCC1 domain-containing protein [Streptomyces sp. NPDC048718]|uniref:RCC1 domain-containing protein n=1 Tax=Streptomyces sp. NPDC048718 TaxID=3365587 RepID=UPI00371F7DD1